MPRVQVPVTQLGYVKAALTTALAGAQNDLTFTAKNAGPGGNEITVQSAVAGASTPLSIVVTGKAIVVNVATDGASAAISTAAQILVEINANSRANLLVSGAGGSGKTTLLRVVAGLAAPTRGELTVEVDRSRVGYLAHDALVDEEVLTELLACAMAVQRVLVALP